MGEILNFPERRAGCCRRWQNGQGAISLAARPACAALALALAGMAPTLKAQTLDSPAAAPRPVLPIR